MPRTERRRPRGASRPGAKKRVRSRARSTEDAGRRGQPAEGPEPTLARMVDRQAASSSRTAKDAPPGGPRGAVPRLLPGARPLEAPGAGDARALEALPAPPSVPGATHGKTALPPDAARPRLRAAGTALTAGGNSFAPGPTTGPEVAGLEVPAGRDRAHTREAEPALARTTPTARGRIAEGTPADATGRTGRRSPGPVRISPEEDEPDALLAAAPPPLPWTLLQPLPFERELSVDGFRLSPDPHALLPPFLSVTSRAWISAASDARLSGLGATETLILDQGLAAPRWAIAGRWAPPALSARPAPVGVAGPIVSEGIEGAVSAPRGAWRASGLLGGPLFAGRLGAVLSIDASGLGLPATEPGLAAGGRSRQTLALTSRWLPGASDRVFLLVLAGRRTESPDCFRCTDAAARLDRELALLAGIGWAHALARGAGLELRLSWEHRTRAAAAAGTADAPSRLDLSRWITDGAPGPLATDVGASTLEETRSRLRLEATAHVILGLQRLDAGVEGLLDGGRRELSLPSGVRFLDRGPDCRTGDTADCAYRVEVDRLATAPAGWAVAAHLEDALHLGDLSVRLGLRLDAAEASVADSSTGLRLGLGPRLALAWNVGGDGRHWLLAHAGRSHQPDLFAVTTRAVLPRQRVLGWTDAAFDACMRPGPGCVQLGGPAALAPGGLPWTDEVALGWRGRPSRGVEGGFEGRWRRTSNLWTEEETGLLTDPEGQWTSRDGAWSSRRTLASDPRSWRQSLALGAWARARAGPARVSLDWALTRVTGNAAGPFDAWLSDPRTAALAEGPLPDDQRHHVTVALALLAHPAVELGARLRYATGAPLWETFSVPGSAALRTVRGSRGTGVLSDVPVILRDPDVFTADAWLRLRLGMLFPGVLPRLDLTIEAAQVAGGNTPVHLSASAGRLGAVLRREPPFQLVLALRAGG